jgi:hypothetical protein
MRARPFLMPAFQPTVLGLLLVACALPAVAIDIQPPCTYPAEPDAAVAMFIYARDTLGAKPAAIGSGDLRPGDCPGRAVELAATLAGRVTLNADTPDTQWVLIRLKLSNGQVLPVASTTPVDGLRDGDTVRAIIEAPPDVTDQTRFQLRAMVLEADLPQPRANITRAPATPPATAPSTQMGSDFRLPPGPGPGRATIPTLAPYGVALPPAPRAGKDGAWDPVDKLGYPAVQQRQLGAWKPWVRRHNSRLTDAQADWIVRWVIYYSALNGVDHRLMFAMIRCESDFNPFCVSRAGATGLTQLMPFNCTDFRVRNKWNVQEQVRAGVEHFKEMLDMWKGRSNYEQFALAAASYNAGPNRVKRAGGIPNITETRNYVKRLGDLFYQLWKDGFP